MSSSQLLLTPSFFRGVGTPPTRWGCSVSSHVSLHDSFASLTVGPFCNLSLLSPESTTFVAILPSGFFVYITMERSTMLFMGKSTISSQFTMGFPIVFPWFSYGFPMVSPFWWNPSFSMVNCCGKSQSPFHTTVVFSAGGSRPMPKLRPKAAASFLTMSFDEAVRWNFFFTLIGVL